MQTSIAVFGMNKFKGIGSSAGFFICAFDNLGYFDSYYNTIDKISEVTGCIVISPGLYPFPIFIPKN